MPVATDDRNAGSPWNEGAPIPSERDRGFRYHSFKAYTTP
jgi:hypothetical protein